MDATRPMTIFLSAGEPSGDLHGANLARALQQQLPSLRCVGFGGERMAEAGVKLLYPLTQLSVMWLGQTLLNLDKFFHLGAMAESYFRRHRPSALVLIDYPGFHWHVAQRARRYGVPVFYFVPPQLWGWAGWRVKKVRRDFHTVLTALPFEEEWYRARGVKTHYVGHPYFDEIAQQKLDDQFMAAHRGSDATIVALLPGSRTQELTNNWAMQLEAAERIAKQRPDVRFLVACYKPSHATYIREHSKHSNLSLEVHIRKTPEIIELSSVCIAVSGSVGLELLVRTTPTVVIYRVGKLLHALGRQLATVKYMSLVNLLAERELFPEFPVCTNEAVAISERILKWLNNPTELAMIRHELEALKQRVASLGAVDRAADFLTTYLKKSIT